MTNASSKSSDQAANTWQEIESLVDELTELSKSPLSAADFHAQLLDRSVRALASVAGAIWISDGQGALHLNGQVNLGATGLPQNGKLQQTHASLLAKSLDLDKPQAIAPRSSSASGLDNPTEFLLVLCPLVLDGDTVGVIELFHAPDMSPRAQRAYLDVAEVIADLAADFHRNRLLRELRDRESSWGQFDRFSIEVHASLDLRSTTYAIVNEARSLLDCDRVSIVLQRGRKCRIHAVSGMDVIDRRATSIRQLQAAAKAVVTTGGPFWHTENDDDDDANIDGRIRDYVKTSCPRTLIILPLKA
ncbi:MAG: hypothetical protein IH991_03600, partial [Planctomycetes bacterium]|nr:hypothetical protein [Planctomycetota bacterium]